MSRGRVERFMDAVTDLPMAEGVTVLLVALALVAVPVVGAFVLIGAYPIVGAPIGALVVGYWLVHCIRLYLRQSRGDDA